MPIGVESGRPPGEEPGTSKVSHSKQIAAGCCYGRYWRFKNDQM